MYTIEIIDTTNAKLVSITENSSHQLHWFQELQQRTFDLVPGYTFEIEAGGIKNPLEPGKTYNVTGSWINYHKDLVNPRFTLGITSAQLITF